MAVRVVGDVEVEEDDAEAAARSLRSMERCTRGAEVVAKMFLGGMAILVSPPRRERSRRNALTPLNRPGGALEAENLSAQSSCFGG